MPCSPRPTRPSSSRCRRPPTFMPMRPGISGVEEPLDVAGAEQDSRLGPMTAYGRGQEAAKRLLGAEFDGCW